MKANDVRVGSEYSCRVNGRNIRVRVTGGRYELTFPGGKPRRTQVFACVEVFSGYPREATARQLAPLPKGLRTPEQDMSALIAYSDPLGAELARLEASIEAKVPVAEARLEADLQAIGREWAREQTYNEAMARS